MGLPAVSVVIPAYNAAQYIGESLNPVFAQTFTDYEVIVVNDGSPDTENLERSLRPFLTRIKYIKQPNRGAGAARNEGVRAARGEFVAFLDADDQWLPNYLDEQMKFLRHHNYDLVCADALHFGESPLAGKTYMETLMPSAPATGEVTLLSLLSAKHSLITSGVLVRRQLVLDVGFFDERLRNAQDFDLWVRLARHGAKLAYQRKVLVRYRSHENSLSGNEINRTNRELRVYDKLESSLDLRPEEREAVIKVMQARRATLHFQLAKIHLEQGNFSEASNSFATAHRTLKAWKTWFSLKLCKHVPFLMQTFYLRRLRRKRGSADTLSATKN
jgi:glycosyltransferase involved in cell wall biosynthesis